MVLRFFVIIQAMKKTIYLAGGCFWGVQAYFDMLKGVISTKVGYANGKTAFPTYEQVKTGTTGHAETVKIDFDDEVISIPALLEHYLRFVDPYSINKQGHDEGPQYRTGVYYLDVLDGVEVEMYLASKLGKDHKIEIQKMLNFFPAEAYHQDYLKKNPGGYCHVDLSLVKPSEKKD